MLKLSLAGVAFGLLLLAAGSTSTTAETQCTQSARARCHSHGPLPEWIGPCRSVTASTCAAALAEARRDAGRDRSAHAGHRTGITNNPVDCS